MKRVAITFQEQALLTPASSVERMGENGWRGRILEISGDHAFVNWGYSKRWHPLYELYPIDELGNPLLPNSRAKVFQTARRGRAAILAIKVQFQSSDSEHIQKELFETKE